MLPCAALMFGIFAGIAAATNITIVNSCGETVWPAIFPAANGGELGGFELTENDYLTISLPDGYSGRIWPRTGCDAFGNCETGACQGGINCTSPAAGGPTLAQFTIDGYANFDYFGPSAVDGFNVPVAITPDYGAECNLGPVICTGQDEGEGCDETFACPTGIHYTVGFCHS